MPLEEMLQQDLARGSRGVEEFRIFQPVKGEAFLRGPVPLAWLTAASRLPGKALIVGIILWHLVGMKKQATVALSGAMNAKCGFSRYTANRALRALEKAGLVEISYAQGRKLRVTLSPMADRPPPSNG